jgi:hypothetical protein
VEDSVEDNETRAYLAKLGLFHSSSMFMITGIIVARGAKSKTSEVRTRDVHGGPGVHVANSPEEEHTADYYFSDFLGVASAGLDAKISNETEVKTNAQITTDFSKYNVLILHVYSGQCLQCPFTSSDGRWIKLYWP